MKKIWLFGFICLFASCVTSQVRVTSASYLTDGIEAYNEGNHEQAVRDFNQAIQLDSNNVNAYLIRGIASFRRGDYNAAIADFDEVLRRDPNNTNASEAREIVINERDRRTR